MSALSRPTVDAGHTPITHTTASIAALADALRTETRLLEGLVATMRTQREAVARDDLDGVDNSVFATHRILMSLGESRRRRRSLNRLLGEGDDLSVAALEQFFGSTLPDDVREATNDLASAARTLQREVDMNRRVLRHAIEAGDHFVRSLYGAGPSKVGYPSNVGQAETPIGAAGGVILDRRA
jgi:hypothetical protein